MPPLVFCEKHPLCSSFSWLLVVESLIPVHTESVDLVANPVPISGHVDDILISCGASTRLRRQILATRELQVYFRPFVIVAMFKPSLDDGRSNRCLETSSSRKLVRKCPQ